MYNYGYGNQVSSSLANVGFGGGIQRSQANLPNTYEDQYGQYNPVSQSQAYNPSLNPHFEQGIGIPCNGSVAGLNINMSTASIPNGNGYGNCYNQPFNAENELQQMLSTEKAQRAKAKKWQDEQMAKFTGRSVPNQGFQNINSPPSFPDPYSNQYISYFGSPQYDGYYPSYAQDQNQYGYNESNWYNGSMNNTQDNWNFNTNNYQYGMNQNFPYTPYNQFQQNNSYDKGNYYTNPNYGYNNTVGHPLKNYQNNQNKMKNYMDTYGFDNYQYPSQFQQKQKSMMKPQQTAPIRTKPSQSNQYLPIQPNNANQSIRMNTMQNPNLQTQPSNQQKSVSQKSGPIIKPQLQLAPQVVSQHFDSQENHCSTFWKGAGDNPARGISSTQIQLSKHKKKFWNNDNQGEDNRKAFANIQTNQYGVCNSRASLPGF